VFLPKILVFERPRRLEVVMTRLILVDHLAPFSRVELAF